MNNLLDELDNFVSALDTTYYTCLLDYIRIPNHQDIAIDMHNLVNKYGANKVNFISENLETIRQKYQLPYIYIQTYIRVNYD